MHGERRFLSRPCQQPQFLLAETQLRRKAEAQVQQVVDVVAPGPLKVTRQRCADFVRELR